MAYISYPLRQPQNADGRFKMGGTAVMKRDKAVVRAALAKWYKISDSKQQDEMYAQVIDTPKKPYPAIDGIKLVMELLLIVKSSGTSRLTFTMRALLRSSRAPSS